MSGDLPALKESIIMTSHNQELGRIYFVDKPGQDHFPVYVVFSDELLDPDLFFMIVLTSEHVAHFREPGF